MFCCRRLHLALAARQLIGEREKARKPQCALFVSVAEWLKTAHQAATSMSPKANPVPRLKLGVGPLLQSNLSSPENPASEPWTRTRAKCKRRRCSAGRKGLRQWRGMAGNRSNRQKARAKLPWVSFEFVRDPQINRSRSAKRTTSDRPNGVGAITNRRTSMQCRPTWDLRHRGRRGKTLDDI